MNGVFKGKYLVDKACGPYNEYLGTFVKETIDD